MKARGQSLVEFALTLPLLLVLVAGVTEVGNFIAIYNRMQATTREAARFGAAGGSDIVGIMRQNADAESFNPILDITEETTRIWEVRPVIDTETNPWSWVGATNANPWGVEGECIYPASCGDADLPISAAQVAEGLENVNDDSVNGTTFTIIVLEYQATSILNMNYFSLGEDGQLPLTTYSVFRQEVEQATVNRKVSGCSAYPIAISQWVLPNNVTEGDTFELDLNDVSLNDTDEFSFLGWRTGHQGPNYLTNATAGSLPFPGNSLDPTNGYEEPGDPSDNSLHRGDWVPYSTATVADASGELQDHSTADRALRVIVYRYSAPSAAEPNPKIVSQGGQVNHLYRIDGFIVVRVNNHSVSGESVTFEYVREDTSCGFAE